jgi:hypothetical protein
MYITSMAQKAKSTGNWRVNNCPVIKRKAPANSLSANSSESQMSAGCTRLQQRKKKEPTTAGTMRLLSCPGMSSSLSMYLLWYVKSFSRHISLITGVMDDHAQNLLSCCVLGSASLALWARSPNWSPIVFIYLLGGFFFLPLTRLKELSLCSVSR